jgi:hypothetical protein
MRIERDDKSPLELNKFECYPDTFPIVFRQLPASPYRTENFPLGATSTGGSQTCREESAALMDSLPSS